MATGRHVLETLIHFATLSTGKGFTACADIYTHPTISKSAEPDILIKQLAGEVIEQRLCTARELVQKLAKLCYQSGVIWIHPERGKAVETNQELNPDEEAALRELQMELARLDTFIQL